METYFLRGICIGLLFGLPVGAVGALTVQRTLAYGFRAGILTGLGSSAADCFYAAVGAFGLTFISDLLMRYQEIIHFLGGTLILFLGIRMAAEKTENVGSAEKPAGVLAIFASSFAVGITNPAAVLTFLFAFSWFRITGPLEMKNGIFLTAGVFMGTFLWWLVLSGAVQIFKQRMKSKILKYRNKLFGAVLSVFGGGILVRIFLTHL